MTVNKLLEKQIRKHLGASVHDEPEMQAFIQEINDTYSNFEKDKELSDHAFLVSDKEYKEIYKKLHQEISLRNTSIQKLKDAIENIQGEEHTILSDREDDLLGIVTYLDQQITKRKEIERELVAAKEAAEASTLSKELFLANMNHEIRTPMNAILGMANQLAKTSMDKKQHFYLDTIHTAAENLLIIINDILDLSKVQSGKLSLEHIGFEPKMVVSRVMQVMMHKAEEKGLQFTNSFCDARLHPVLMGDPYRLNQVLLNLVSNAIKFTPKGLVDISCKVIEDMENTQKVKITITDTGIGMNEKFSKNLFQKFSQEDNSIIRKYGGTGLGMSICKELIDLMGGEITVQSEKDKGTAIAITLELAKGKSTDIAVKEQSETDIRIFSGKEILVADDNEMNQLVVEAIMQHYDTKITKVFNGVEALQMLEKKNFDIVLMDVQMPEMDGFEATRQIRKLYGNYLPVIALTAFAIKGDNQKCLDVGMDDYLSKPFEESQLLAMLSKWLKLKSTSTQTKMAATLQEVHLFSLHRLEKLSNGNKDFLNKMIDLFVTITPQSVLEIKGAFDKNDFEKISKIAHRLKPSIDNMEIIVLKETLRKMELFEETKHTKAELKNWVDQVEEVIHKVVQQINNLK